MTKERLTITLSPRLLEDIDKLIDGQEVTSRSNAIEKILRQYFIPQDARKAIILAGGQGMRLRPITYELPKPMITIKGKPILEYIINKLKEADFKDIIVSIGYLGDRIKEYFGDGEKFGVNIRYVEEKAPLGTGGALRSAQHLIHDDVMVVNGDNIFDFDLSKIYEFHKKERSFATMAVATAEDVSAFGVVEMDGNRITNFIEKPTTRQSTHLVNAGIYVLNSMAISMLPEGNSNLSDLFPKLAEKGRLNGFIYSGKWFACDNLQLYERAIKYWK